MKLSFTALTALTVLTLGTFASAQELRYSTTAPGGITATGNTLGLSKESNANGPGVADSIGTFLTLGNDQDILPLNPLNPWPTGTTNDWTKNGSSAVLNLPGESTVLYAELLWGGSFAYGSEDVSAFLNTPVTLTAGASTLMVNPDPMTAITESSTAASGFNVRYYVRSADVTSFVQTAGAGMFSVMGVPATQDTNINSLNAAGWTLVVAYRDEGAPTRNLSVFVGGSFVDEDSQQDYSVSGFCAPPVGEVTGTAVVSTIEGDATYVGDQLLIAPDIAGPFIALSGPNNPADNFFCSQLNDENGMLDTQGTYGDKNHNAMTGTNISGGRQGWDVTTVPLSSQNGQLFAGQKSAVLRTITTGDSYMPILASFAIDVNAPQLGGQETTMTALPDTVTLNDKLTVTATIKNTSQVDAQALVFKMDPGMLALTDFTSDGMAGDIGGTTVTPAMLANGVNEGTLGAGQTRTVEITFNVAQAPASQFQYLLATWSYGYEACVGEPLLEETLSRNAIVKYEAPMGTGGSGGAGGSNTGGMSAGGSSAGGSSAGGSSAGGSNAGGSEGGSGGGDGGSGANNVGDSGGCSCRTTGGETPGGALLSLSLLGLFFARRRRQSAARTKKAS